ncbi:Peptidase M76, ATP23 [Dillenia turbinata]|uniref:Mitochondrial inner membrane protease ATP23 n=1 Tax=Dillenia turbinata TaxID=194707 RepID=A0AAN8VEE1_9MAGN
MYALGGSAAPNINGQGNRFLAPDYRAGAAHNYVKASSLSGRPSSLVGSMTAAAGALNCKKSSAYQIMVCGNHMNLQDDVNNEVRIPCDKPFLIRAGHLSGDCHYKRELLRGYIKMRGHEQDCVRRRVMKSLTANPYCSEAAVKDAMEAVWEICYKDTKPFDRAP